MSLSDTDADRSYSGFFGCYGAFDMQINDLLIYVLKYAIHCP